MVPGILEYDDGQQRLRASLIEKEQADDLACEGLTNVTLEDSDLPPAADYAPAGCHIAAKRLVALILHQPGAALRSGLRCPPFSAPLSSVPAAVYLQASTAPRRNHPTAQMTGFRHCYPCQSHHGTRKPLHPLNQACCSSSAREWLLPKHPVGCDARKHLSGSMQLLACDYMWSSFKSSGDIRFLSLVCLVPCHKSIC